MRSIRRLQSISFKSLSCSHASYKYCNKSGYFYTTCTKTDVKSQFDEDGYLMVRNALNEYDRANLITWLDEIEKDAFKQKNDLETARMRLRGLHHFETDKLTKEVRICRSERLIDFHDGLKELLCSGQLKSIVSECFGEECVLYKEKINYKYPNCGVFKPHQDAPAYPDIHRSISVAISVDDACEISGCLEFAKGRHKDGVIGQNNEGIICDDIVENIEKREKLIYEAVPTKNGDIVLFDGYVPHRSGSNTSDKSRRIIYATYNPLSEGDLREKYYERKKKDMLDGKISFIFDFDGDIISTVGK